MRIAKTSIVLMLACGAAMAQAAIRVDCSDRFADDLKWKLSEPEKPVFGVKAKDWTVESVREWQRQALACINAKANWSEDAMKAPMRQSVNAMAASASTDLFAVRDEAMRKQGLAAKVTDQKLTQVVLNGDGKPQEIKIVYATGDRTELRTCRTIQQGIGLAKFESYRQAVAFARMCQQVGQTEASTVASLERQAAGMDAIYDALDALTNQVEAATKQPVSEAKVKELTANRDRVAVQLKTLSLPLDDGYYQYAVSKIEKMQEQLNARACKDQFVKVGMPAAWKDNFIVLEFNSPESFAGIVCAALRNGAQVRYLSGGLLSKEGFEVKSPKRTVQVYTEAHRPAGGDPGVQVMVPVAAQVDGKKTDVTRNNLRALAAELIAAMRNQ
ncbi:MAG: hypothetical protein RL211_1549 [Pseudomonadota bacterium]|jgi:predicted dinucleotide-utilizing enzyme